MNVVHGDNWMALNYIDVANGDTGMALNYIDVVNGDTLNYMVTH